MEITSAQSKALQTLVGNWLAHPEHELEATFGAGGKVDATTFLAIAQRLRAKGYESLPQDDRLSVLTPDKVRLSLQGVGVIQQYCKDDTLEGKPYSAMIKDRSSMESNLDLAEYDIRIKSRREIPLAETDPRVKKILDGWNQQKKAFRLIRRWTFRGKGIRIDMSMVRSTATDATRDYRWVRSFLEHNIFKSPVEYEVEVELLRGEDTASAAGALACLVRGVGEVARAIQKNTLLIRKSVAAKVLESYKALNDGNDRFRGVSPVTLEHVNMVEEIDDAEPNIRTGYNVTDKADGLRALGFCDSTGELFLIDMGMNVYRTALRSVACANSLVDGEWVTRSKDNVAINHFLIFDIYKAAGKVDVAKLPFAKESTAEESRWKQLNAWIEAWKEGVGPAAAATGLTEQTKLQVSLKKFQFAAAGTEIFAACSRILDIPRIYHTDGLILTPNSAPLPEKSGDTFYEQFKWKPAKDNTIDFLATYEKNAEALTIDKIATGIHPDSGETVRFKTLRLYVGAAKDPIYDDPRLTILNDEPIGDASKTKAAYQPIPFNPIDFPDTMANICYREITVDPESGEDFVTTEDSGEPIPDRCIIECRYNAAAAPGWRWVPMRIRHDKTERLQRKQIGRTLNSEKVAMSVWNSIHDPVTEHMIRTGADVAGEEAPAAVAAEEVGKRYYERKEPEESLAVVRGLRDFHNRVIKEDILYKTILEGGKKTLVDVACGKGGDLQRWRRKNAAFVLGVDTAGDNIRSPQDGAYRRYLNTRVQMAKPKRGAGGPKQVPPMVFIIGDSSKHLINGEAGATPQEADMLRAIFGQVAPTGPVPKFVETMTAGILRPGADAVSCMFALHYFFESKETLDGLIENLRTIVKVGGYFGGCCFDGQKVFNLLRSVEKGHSSVGMDGDKPVWTITKEYEAEEIMADETSVGMAIDVEFITIGAKHREYLVSFDYFKSRMEDIGFGLLNAAELKELRLRESSSTFDATFKKTSKADETYPMSDAVKQFSFLNRWFIFKRRGEIGVQPVEKAVEAAAEALAPGAGAAAGAAGAAAAPEDRKYLAGEVLLVYPRASLNDSLRIGDKGAARWLALNAPFPIEDKESGVTYPSVEHYLAGMRLKHAGSRADLAANLFSEGGSIHQKYLGKRKLEKVSDVRDYELLAEESADVVKALKPTALRPYGVKFDEALWASMKDSILMDAIRQRWESDARFHKIVEAARTLNRYILYYTGPGGSNELSGVHQSDGRIVGENKVGKAIMEIANFSV